MHSFQYAPDYTLIYMEPFIHLHVHTVFLAGRTGIHRRVDRQSVQRRNACDRRNRPWRYVRYQGVFQ